MILDFQFQLIDFLFIIYILLLSLTHSELALEEKRLFLEFHWSFDQYLNSI